MGNIFIISSPSGGGKTTVAELLVKSFYNFSKIITYTTRKPRHNEQDKKDYFFITKEQFLSYKNTGFFIETTFYNNHYYGSSHESIQRVLDSKITNSILVTDINGVKSYQTAYPNIVTIWLQPPSLTLLEKRLKKRNTESAEQINNRLILAHHELLEAGKVNFSYSIINNILEETLDHIKKIIETIIKR